MFTCFFQYLQNDSSKCLHFFLCCVYMSIKQKDNIGMLVPDLKLRVKSFINIYICLHFPVHALLVQTEFIFCLISNLKALRYNLNFSRLISSLLSYLSLPM